MYVTRVESDVDGDVFFPEWGEGWHKVSEESFPADEKNDFPTVFEVWERE
jgi:dihydrofolate reductase